MPSPFDLKKFERSLLKDKIKRDTEVQPRSQGCLEADDETGRKRERPRSVLIPSRTNTTGSLFGLGSKANESEEAKSPGSAAGNSSIAL